MRAAVQTVRRSFGDLNAVADAWSSVMASRWRRDRPASAKTVADQAAWALVSMRIVGRSLGDLDPYASLRDAESWFLGPIRPPKSLSGLVAAIVDGQAARALERISYGNDLRDLLPYVLESLGPGSRASVKRDSRTRESRRAKKAGGVFYTPSDVAEYIASEALGGLGERCVDPLVLDPACGSGVFLKAALESATRRAPGLDRFGFVEGSLYGIDISPLAVEAACFVLLRECLEPKTRRCNTSPWSLWHRIRCNFCVGDALDFTLAPPPRDDTESLAALRKAVDQSYVSPAWNGGRSPTASALFPEGVGLGSVFPELATGVDAVIGNPPYAAIGPREDAAALQRRYASLSASRVSQGNYFPVFVELMWRLARRGRSSSGMVVPLSLAYNRRAQMVAVRRGIMNSGGRWRFAFFDREPHALFGEEVKTRSAIAFRLDDAEFGGCTTIETGPLRKWNSRQRSSLFSSIEFTPLPGSLIVAGIPKLAGKEPAGVFAELMRRPTRLHQMCASVQSCQPSETVTNSSKPRVFVAGTAYNFLGVFRPHRSLPTQRAPWSSSNVLALEFAGEDEAARAFAYLGSRVAYWLWHVTEDGFHVSRSFVLNLPLADTICDEIQKKTLADCGVRLWNDVQTQQVLSVNGGRQTISYRPYASDHLRDEIDSLLLEALGVAPSFAEYLQCFTRATATVGGHNKRRRLASKFIVGGRECSA